MFAANWLKQRLIPMNVIVFVFPTDGGVYFSQSLIIKTFRIGRLLVLSCSYGTVCYCGTNLVWKKHIQQHYPWGKQTALWIQIGIRHCQPKCGLRGSWRWLFLATWTLFFFFWKRKKNIFMALYFLHFSFASIRFVIAFIWLYQEWLWTVSI